MPRRGENIFKRKDGRWEARYIKGRDLSGRAKYGYCYGRTYTEAREKVAPLRVKPEQGDRSSAARRRLPLSHYCHCWAEQHRPTVKPSTYAKYMKILEKYIVPQLGDCLPTALTTETAERFRGYLLTERGLSAKTTRDILTVLRMVLAYTRKELSGAMPEVEIVYPRAQKKEMRVLSRQEQAKLVEYLMRDTDCCKCGVYLALTTGLRIGELCALRWRDVSLANATVTVSATMQRLPSFDGSGPAKTVISIDEPKSSASARTIPLTKAAVALCQRFLPPDGDAYLLTGTESYMEPRTLQYRFHHYIKECGLENVHFHTLRHTFATRCVEVGFEVKSLSEILGHANTSITLNRYVHSSMELKRNKMEKLSAAGL